LCVQIGLCILASFFAIQIGNLERGFITTLSQHQEHENTKPKKNSKNGVQAARRNAALFTFIGFAYTENVTPEKTNAAV